MLSLLTSKITRKRLQQVATVEADLAGRWDLSRTFSLSGEGEANGLIAAINLIFSRLHAFAVDLTRRNVETATVAPLTQAIAGKVRASSESLAREVEQIEATCRILAEGIGNSADSASRALEQSALIVTKIDRTSGLTGEALQRMLVMEQEVERLNGAIAELDRRSRDIGSIIESISEIADHTGLLSLNAFIEAARAGVHGAGFGVIAQEIRQLSQQSAEAAGQVSDSLTGISALIGETVTAVTRVRVEVNAGLTGNREASSALDQVCGEHRRFHRHLESVIAAVDDQKKAMALFADDLPRIAAIGKEGRGDSGRLAELADKIKQLTEQQLLATGIFILPQYRKAEKVVAAMAETMEIRSPGQHTDQVLRQQVRNHSYLELLYLTDVRGIQVSANVLRNGPEVLIDSSVRGKDWSRKNWFRQVRETGQTHISDIYKSEATDSFCLTISVPVYHLDSWTGVLGADINFEDLLSI